MTREERRQIREVIMQLERNETSPQSAASELRQIVADSYYDKKGEKK